MFLYDWRMYRNISEQIDNRYKKMIEGYRKTISQLVRRCRKQNQNNKKNFGGPR